MEFGSTRLAEVCDATKTLRLRPEAAPVGLHGLWERHRGETLRVPEPIHQLTGNTPVMPKLPQDVGWSDGEELDIIESINGLVGDRNTDFNDGLTTRRQ